MTIKNIMDIASDEQYFQITVFNGEDIEPVSFGRKCELEGGEWMYQTVTCISGNEYEDDYGMHSVIELEYHEEA